MSAVPTGAVGSYLCQRISKSPGFTHCRWRSLQASDGELHAIRNGLSSHHEAGGPVSRVCARHPRQLAGARSRTKIREGAGEERICSLRHERTAGLAGREHSPLDGGQEGRRSLGGSPSRRSRALVVGARDRREGNATQLMGQVTETATATNCGLPRHEPPATSRRNSAVNEGDVSRWRLSALLRLYTECQCRDMRVWYGMARPGALLRVVPQARVRRRTDLTGH